MRSPDKKGRDALLKVFYGVVIVGLLVYFSWKCAGDEPEPVVRPDPLEQRELEQAKRTVETACGLWWDGVLDLPDHQAQVCIDVGYGR